MTPVPPQEKPDDSQPLEGAVRTRRERRNRQKRGEERSVGQNLSMIGVLGITIVTPTLMGIFLGRWLDRELGPGVFWTLGLLVAGLVLGCALAWNRIGRE